MHANIPTPRPGLGQRHTTPVTTLEYHMDSNYLFDTPVQPADPSPTLLSLMNKGEIALLGGSLLLIIIMLIG
jgi:hypothetical protein